MIGLLSLAALTAIAVGCGRKLAATEDVSLKEAFDGKFLFGSAINDRQVAGEDSIGANLVKKHFNTVVAENCMKSEKINPRQGYYNWGPADAFVKFGEDNGMFVVGHCLVWHSQLAPWFPVDKEGNFVSADTLRERMRCYITDVMTRYKGRVRGWDVVNEAVNDDGTYRQTPFYEILGEEYIPYAFELAHQADPEAELYINDYGMDKPARRQKYLEIIKNLQERGLRIDAVGMQCHMGMDYPPFTDFEASIKAFGGLGCKVMLTEWDMSALPTITQSANISDIMNDPKMANPYPDGLPQEVADTWNLRMDSVMEICLRNSDIVSRINVWGVSDGDSWKNDFPVPGRKDYPLAFDRDYNMKPFLSKYLKKGV